SSSLSALTCFHHPSTLRIYTLSLHDALPIFRLVIGLRARERGQERVVDVDGASVPFLREFRRQHLHVARQHQQVDALVAQQAPLDRKSTRLNSSHVKISYAVFCLKKKKKQHP